MHRWWYYSKEELCKMFVNRCGNVLYKFPEKDENTIVGKFNDDFLCHEQDIIIANEKSCYPDADLSCDDCSDCSCDCGDYPYRED